MFVNEIHKINKKEKLQQLGKCMQKGAKIWIYFNFIFKKLNGEKDKEEKKMIVIKWKVVESGVILKR